MTNKLNEKTLPIHMDAEQRRGYEEYYGIKLICKPGWEAEIISKPTIWEESYNGLNTALPVQNSPVSLLDNLRKTCKNLLANNPEISTFLTTRIDDKTVRATPLMILQK